MRSALVACTATARPGSLVRNLRLRRRHQPQRLVSSLLVLSHHAVKTSTQWHRLPVRRTEYAHPSPRAKATSSKYRADSHFKPRLCTAHAVLAGLM